ncbi:4Fe-4S binding protein [Lachnospiraceae bacterium 46-15]
MRYVQMIFSPTGGTRRAAEIITSEWSSAVETVDLSDPAGDFSKSSFAPEDVVLIALPSYGGRVPAAAAERLSQVRGNSANCVLLCVYGNRAYEDTMVEMADMAKNCGFTVTAAISAVAEHSIMHQFATGRPDGKDMQELKSYAKTILEKIKTGISKDELQVPGNRPYKKAGGAGLVPKATKDCTDCGLCAEQCPVQAIDRGNIKRADSRKCISCMRCVVKCPNSARKVNSGMVAAASLVIKNACSVRKDCELFI